MKKILYYHSGSKDNLPDCNRHDTEEKKPGDGFIPTLKMNYYSCAVHPNPVSFSF